MSILRREPKQTSLQNAFRVTLSHKSLVLHKASNCLWQQHFLLLQKGWFVYPHCFKNNHPSLFDIARDLFMSVKITQSEG